MKELFGETYYNAAKRSIDYILGGSQSESVGYVVPVLSCNEYGVMQERMLILTNRALYRVKYDYTKNKIVHYRTTRLKDIVCTYFGKLFEGLVTFGDFAVKIVTTKVDGRGNIMAQLQTPNVVVNKKYTGDEQETPKPLKRKVFFRVYKSLLPSVFGKFFCQELASVISAVSKRRLFEEDVRWCHLGGPIAPVLNYLDIGRWNKRIRSDEAKCILERLQAIRKVQVESASNSSPNSVAYIQDAPESGGNHVKPGVPFGDMPHETLNGVKSGCENDYFSDEESESSIKRSIALTPTRVEPTKEGAF